MLRTRLDHIIVAARSLDEGADWVESRLGVRTPPGGRHEMMGTHNRVMALGDSVYLEIIAVDPGMAPPARPRWFGLDDPSVIRSLADSPRLLTWAVNTDDLEVLTASSRTDVGEILEARRDDLRWKVALPDDGRLGAGGFFPLCIQWQMDFHPASCMPDPGCRLHSLTLYHPYPEWLRGLLEAIGADTTVCIEEVDDPAAARLVARIETPDSMIELSA